MESNIKEAQDVLDFAFGKGKVNAVFAGKSSTALVITKQYKDKPVRLIQDNDGEIWFVAKDVCNALGLKYVTKALKALDDDEKGLKPIQTPGGLQVLNMVSESGRYRLTMRCDKVEAKPFQNWVVREVLPTIRRTGGYAISPQDEVSQLIGAVKDLVGLVQGLLAERVSTPELPKVKTIAAKDQISQLVRKYAVKNKLDFEWCWKELYRDFMYRYHINLLERAQNKNTTGVAIAEELGCIDDLLALAIHLYQK
jgi:prophage antirepressor-like protein